MAENKKSFLIYCDLISTVEKMPDDKAGLLFKHILRYVNDLNPVTDDLLIDLTFEAIKLQMKRDLKKYEAICDRNRNNGLLGGRPPKPKETQSVNLGLNKNPEKPKKPDTDTDTDTDINISFSEFWNLYNKKVGDKQKAEKKWIKLSNDERQKIIDTLPGFISSIKDKQFQPYPERYLNNSRWNDEININTSSNKKHYYLSSPFGTWDGLLTEDEFKAKTLTNYWTLVKIS